MLDQNINFLQNKFIYAFTALILTLVLSKFLKKTIQSLTLRSKKGQTISDLFGTIAQLIALIVGGILILRILNLDSAAASILAGAGIVGVALGFAFQDIAANLMAGVTLSIQKEMSVGDLVKVGDYYGHVRKIELRMTQIKTLSGQLVYIPNKELLLSTVEDYSRLQKRRVELSVGVSYKDDLENVKQVALQAVQKIPEVLEKEPVDLYFTEFDASSINFTVRFWIKFKKETDWLEAQSTAIVSIKKAFDKEGITIPFPIATVEINK